MYDSEDKAGEDSRHMIEELEVRTRALRSWPGLAFREHDPKADQLLANGWMRKNTINGQHLTGNHGTEHLGPSNYRILKHDPTVGTHQANNPDSYTMTDGFTLIGPQGIKHVM